MTGIGIGIAAMTTNGSARIVAPVARLPRRGRPALAVELLHDRRHRLGLHQPVLPDHGADLRRRGRDRGLAAPPRAADRGRAAARRWRPNRWIATSEVAAAGQPARPPQLAARGARASRRRRGPRGDGLPGSPSPNWPSCGTASQQGTGRPATPSSATGSCCSHAACTPRERAGRARPPVKLVTDARTAGNQPGLPSPASSGTRIRDWNARRSQSHGRDPTSGQARRRVSSRQAGSARCWAPRWPGPATWSSAPPPSPQASLRRAEELLPGVPIARPDRGRRRAPTWCCWPCPTTSSPAWSADSSPPARCAPARSSCTPAARRACRCSRPPPSSVRSRSRCTRS